MGRKIHYGCKVHGEGGHVCKTATKRSSCPNPLPKDIDVASSTPVHYEYEPVEVAYNLEDFMPRRVVRKGPHYIARLVAKEGPQRGTYPSLIVPTEDPKNESQTVRPRCKHGVMLPQPVDLTEALDVLNKSGEVRNARREPSKNERRVRERHDFTLEEIKSWHSETSCEACKFPEVERLGKFPASPATIESISLSKIEDDFNLCWWSEEERRWIHPTHRYLPPITDEPSAKPLSRFHAEKWRYTGRWMVNGVKCRTVHRGKQVKFVPVIDEPTCSNPKHGVLVDGCECGHIDWDTGKMVLPEQRLLKETRVWLKRMEARKSDPTVEVNPLEPTYPFGMREKLTVGDALSKPLSLEESHVEAAKEVEHTHDTNDPQRVHWTNHFNEPRTTIAAGGSVPAQSADGKHRFLPPLDQSLWRQNHTKEDLGWLMPETGDAYLNGVQKSKYRLAVRFVVLDYLSNRDKSLTYADVAERIRKDFSNGGKKVLPFAMSFENERKAREILQTISARSVEDNADYVDGDPPIEL